MNKATRLKIAFAGMLLVIFLSYAGAAIYGSALTDCDSINQCAYNALADTASGNLLILWFAFVLLATFAIGGQIVIYSNE